MGSLILCRSAVAKHPYYVPELGIRIYSGEELSYFIYHNLMLLGDHFLDERLFRFINQELGMPELETKLRKWAGQADQAELLLVILQDIHYYDDTELKAFRSELYRLKAAKSTDLMKEKADYFFRRRRYYDAIRCYREILTGKSEESGDSAFLGDVWFCMGSALAGIFSFDRAVDCYQHAYELLHAEEALQKIYEIHLMDSLSVFPEELFADVPTETIHRWKENFEQMKKQAALEGKAKGAFALTNEDSVRRAVGFCRLVQDWKNEYRRSQG